MPRGLKPAVGVAFGVPAAALVGWFAWTVLVPWVGAVAGQVLAGLGSLAAFGILLWLMATTPLMPPGKNDVVVFGAVGANGMRSIGSAAAPHRARAS
jgi:hypothetical protein